MSDLKTFLKIVQKLGYPDPKPDSLTIAKSINYDLAYFLDDLQKSIGQQKSEDFVQNTFSKLGATYSPGIKINLDESDGSYIYLIINGFGFYEDNEEYDEVWISYTWGDSRLDMGDEGYKTLQEIWNELDLGDMGEYNEMIDDIMYQCRQKIWEKTGLVIRFDSQI
jgi:hypothetical protein